VWQMGQCEEDQQEIGANSSFVQRARLESKDVKRRLKTKLRAAAAGPIQSRLTPAVLSPSSNSHAIGGLGESET